MGQLPSLRWTTIVCKWLDVHITVSNVVSLYMVPGGPASLARICVGGSNLLLLYVDDRARLWDVKTLEFRRSMDLEKAKELLAQGGWTELSVPLLSFNVVLKLTPIAGLFAIRLQWETYLPRCRVLRLIQVCFVSRLASMCLEKN
jgi:hypothetical protein